MTDRSTLLELAHELEAGSGLNNALDVRVEIALFRPDENWASIRANAAGTKVICRMHTGNEATFWAPDWTRDRASVAGNLRALANQPEDKSQ